MITPQRGFVPLCRNLDAAVRQIPDPAVEPLVDCRRLYEVPEAYPLHAAADDIKGQIDPSPHMWRPFAESTPFTQQRGWVAGEPKVFTTRPLLMGGLSGWWW